MASRAPLDLAAAHNLALAMVSCSETPLVLLDGDLHVVAASLSFCRSFQVDPDAVADRSIFALGAGEWDTRKLRSLLSAVRSGGADVDAYGMDLKQPDQETRHLVLNVHRIEFGEAENLRLLVTITDVTLARAAEQLKEELIRKNGILLQEVQHRVANSLQNIASVLLQSARKVRSKETRAHLNEAHNRVMSIATVQKQLSLSQVGPIALAPYFTQLCDSLGASMIRDHDQLSIEVQSDASAVEGEVSVSLGLIVTELVINALKHAFPGDRHGKIKVGYQSRGADWTLTVSDDGVGMAGGAAVATPGLGTSIVEALAHQLQAKIVVSDAHPGTNVSIIFSKSAGGLDEPRGPAA